VNVEAAKKQSGSTQWPQFESYWESNVGAKAVKGVQQWRRSNRGTPPPEICQAKGATKSINKLNDTQSIAIQRAHHETVGLKGPKDAIRRN